MSKNEISDLLRNLAFGQVGVSVCNFCGDSEPLVRYVIHDVSPEEQNISQVGQWLACGPCATMISQKNTVGLLTLAKVRLHGVLDGKLDTIVIDAQIREMQERFWKTWRHSEDEPV